jgi:hypothetical protein
MRWRQFAPCGQEIKALQMPPLSTQESVLLNKIAKNVSVLAVQPPGDDGEQQRERRGVNHGGNLYHGPGFRALSPVDPAPGHYGMAVFRALSH